MSNKAILDVEIDDSEFSEFKNKFDEYETAVKSMPEYWQAAGSEITAQKTHFEKAASELTKIGNIAFALERVEDAADKIAVTTALAWISLAKSGKLFAGNVVHATQSLMHWTKLTAVFSGILGAGGLFGINRMAAGVAGQRTSAAGLGVTYGEQASFLTNFGRLGNAEGILQGFSEAETDVSKKYALRQYLGHTESGDPAKDFAEGLGRFKEFVDKTPRELLEPMLQARGYDKLGIGREQAHIVRGMSREEVAQLGRGYQSDLAGRLGLSDTDAKKWTEFSIQMERAGLEIENVFAKGTIKLTKPLEHLSESFINLTENLLKDGSPIAGWIKDLGKGMRTFADEVGSGTVQAKTAGIGKDITDTVKLFDDIIAKAPRGLAVLAGMAVGARFGGAAVAAGTALARAGILGTLGEGAVVLGATAWGMNKLMPQHPERLRQGQEYENAGGSPTSPHPAQTEHRRRFGHPHFNAGAAQSGAAAPGTPWNSAPLGPGMGRYNFMHGQFGGPGQNLTRVTTRGGHTVTVNQEAAPHFRGFLNDLEAAGAPIHQSQLGGYSDRPIAGRYTKSHHAYGNAVDIDSSGRNIIAPDFAAWARAHDKELHAAESRWGIRAGRDMSNPDMGHWEWGGGAGSGGTSRRQSFGHMGHHPATVGKTPKTLTIEDHTGGLVTVVPQ